MAYLIDQRHSPRITGGGLLTTQGTIPAAGADLGLRFRLPISDRSVQVTANVRWTAPGRAGVAFVSLNPQAQEEIWRYHARVTAGRLQGSSATQASRQTPRSTGTPGGSVGRLAAVPPRMERHLGWARIGVSRVSRSIGPTGVEKPARISRPFWSVASPGIEIQGSLEFL